MIAVVLALVGVLASAADPAGPPPLVETVPGGRIDWTALRLEVIARSNVTVGAWKDRRLQEQDVLDRIEHQVAVVSREVRVTPGTTAGDLADDPGDVGRRVNEGLGAWRISETVYDRSGSVEMTAVLELGPWLRPALLSLAGEAEAARGSGGAASEPATGLVVDGRALPFRPCLAPQVSAPTGVPLVRAQALGEDAIRLSSAVVYVADPADPLAAARTGAHPLFARAASVRGDCELVLDPGDALRLAGHPELPDLVRSGRVAIVADPLE